MKCHLSVVVLLMSWTSPWSQRFAASQEVLTVDNIKADAEEALIREELGKHEATRKDCDKGTEETVKHQVWLFTKYRGVWQYRRTGHFYDGKYLDKGDVKDEPEHSGSVIFTNYQNTTLYLNCPCSEKGNVDEWKMYGKGSHETFNKNRDSYKSKVLKIKAPPPRYYYRTFSCRVGEHVHYFNVFTRPLGLTGLPPLMYTEGVAGPADDINKISCNLLMYEKLRKKPARFYYIPVPFQFYWEFPDGPQTTPERLEHNRPPHDTGDNLFWAKQPLHGTEVSSAHLPNPGLFTAKNFGQVPRHDVCEERKVPVPEPDEKVLLGTALEVEGGGRKEHAGLYACIVVDGNGLSSAFWWDGDEPPHDRFRGFTQIRVRAVKYIYAALGVCAGLLVLTALMILILPDNKDDFTFDTPEEPPPVEANVPPPKAEPSVVKSPTSANSVTTGNNVVVTPPEEVRATATGPLKPVPVPEVKPPVKKP